MAIRPPISLLVMIVEQGENGTADRIYVNVVFWEHAGRELQEIASNFISLDALRV